MSSVQIPTKSRFIESLEKIPTKIFLTPLDGAKWVAFIVSSLIKEKEFEGGKCVLGLATGSTPKLLYAELVRMHKEEGLSFRNVVAFNLDEYYPIAGNALQSYHRFMKQQLFDKVDILPENCHIPNGGTRKEAIKAHCAAYDNAIELSGGIDLQILGIGSNGHIGFNEPGSSIYSRTRLVNLDHSTRLANSFEFSRDVRGAETGHNDGYQYHLKVQKGYSNGLGEYQGPCNIEGIRRGGE